MRTRPIALTLLVLFGTIEALAAPPALPGTPRTLTREDQRDVMVTRSKREFSWRRGHGPVK
jgi:hypothetical protein